MQKPFVINQTVHVSIQRKYRFTDWSNRMQVPTDESMHYGWKNVSIMLIRNIQYHCSIKWKIYKSNGAKKKKKKSLSQWACHA